MELDKFLFGNSYVNYEIEPRQAYRTEFNKLRYAIAKKNRWKEDEEHAFENDVFALFTYSYDVDCDCGYEENTHKETCILNRPNFYHKRSGLKISWRKNLLWDARSSHPFDLTHWRNLMDDCIRSLGYKVNNEIKNALAVVGKKDGSRDIYLVRGRPHRKQISNKLLITLKMGTVKMKHQIYDDTLMDEMLWQIAELHRAHQMTFCCDGNVKTVTLC